MRGFTLSYCSCEFTGRSTALLDLWNVLRNSFCMIAHAVHIVLPCAQKFASLLKVVTQAPMHHTEVNQRHLQVKELLKELLSTRLRFRRLCLQ